MSLFLLPALSATAADLALEPVVVSGTREPEPLSRSTADIVVIDAATIRNTTADSVEDLIRREAGMQLVRNGGPGQSTGFFIRGASTNSTVVLIDGVRVGSASLGQAEFEALSLAQIDRIEVLRGPASSLYGADAVGGVVQIFTRRGVGPPRFAGSVALGGYASRQGDIAVSGSSGAFDYAATLGGERSRGVSALFPNDPFGAFNPDRDGYSRRYGNLRLGYTPVAGHRIGIALLETRLNAQFDSAEFNPPAFTPDPTPDFRNHLTTRVVSADYRGDIGRTWTTTLQLARAVDDLRSGGTTLDRFVTRREQATWQNAIRFAADQQLVVAYEHRRERADAATLAGIPERRNDAGVLGYSGRSGPHSVQADARFDHNSVYGSNTTGRLGYAFEAAPGLKLRALAGTSFRAPTLNDLFFNDPVFGRFGVPTVRPERGRSVEIGIAWQREQTMLSATLYRNRVHDLIGPQPERALCPPDPSYNLLGCAGNTSRARLQGATLAGAQRWGGLDVRASVDVLDAKDADSGHRLPRRAAYQGSGSADYSRDAWSAGASVLVVGSRPEPVFPASFVVLGGYATLDLRGAWRFAPSWRLEARLLNALDHRIEPVRGYQGLGRQAWLGVRYDGAGV